MHPGAVSMRVSFVLRSAEAYLVAQCNLKVGNYRANNLLCGLYKLIVAYNLTIGQILKMKKSRQLRGVPRRSPSLVLTWPCIA